MKLSVNHQDAMKRIPVQIAFTASALSAVPYPAITSGRLAGEDLAAWREHGVNSTYTILSYATPIAWHSPERGWYLVQQKFSVTTSKHQSYVRRALTTVGV